MPFFDATVNEHFGCGKNGDPQRRQMSKFTVDLFDGVGSTGGARPAGSLPVSEISCSRYWHRESGSVQRSDCVTTNGH